MGARTPLTTLTRGRRRAFLGVTLALPWLLLALVEVGLRAGGYGGAYPLFVRYADDPRFLLPNEEVGRRWFRGGFVPSTHLDFFRAEKGARTLRLVVQGESSAAGFPYGHGGAPSRILERRLQGAFPDRDVEVVNTALTAVSSYVLLDQADEIIAQRPDAVLIYTGHNEYYGVFGAASTRSLGTSPRFIRAYLGLRRLRLVQLVDDVVARGTRAASVKRPSSEAPGTVMELMAGDRLVPLGSARYEAGLAQFRANLDALLARYAEERIPVFMGTLVSNERDQQPLAASLGAAADRVAWRRAFDRGLASLARADTAATERALDEAVRIDSTAADGLFLLGRLRDAQGDSAAARALYRRAKESDPLRFRAPEAMNAVIREVAARRGATVVETQRAVEQASPKGIPGRSLILEHLHPNIDGNVVIADAFYHALRRVGGTGVLGAQGTWPAVSDPVAELSAARRNAPITSVDSMAALLRTNRLTSGWPFRPHDEADVAIADTLHPRTALDSLAQRLVNGQLSWAEATDRWRADREQAGDADEATRAALALAAEYRYSAQPYLDAARIAAARGRYDDALGFAQRANARRETPESAALLAELRGPAAAARMLPSLEAARAQAPRDTAALYRLAAAYALTRQYDRARATARALLSVAPSHAAGRALLNGLPR